MKVLCCIGLLLFGYVSSYGQSGRPRVPPVDERSRVQLPQNKPQVQPSRDVQWQPIVEMGGIVFPSLILATATSEAPPSPLTYIGDAYGIFGISIVNPKANALVVLTIQVDNIASPATYEVTLPQAGTTYEIFPPLDYRFDFLRRVLQPFPINVNFQLQVDNGTPQLVSKRAQVRPINECPFAWSDRNGTIRQYGWMYAAYVNEDHPWIDGLLREAINTKVVSGFIGYQGSRQDVITQVYAIWNILQRRGFKYSSIAATSTSSEKVYSQRVRFLSDSINTAQANCVDGSVLFASILRKIGLDVYLILMPGHCLLGIWQDQEHRSAMFLETTMLGHTDLKDFSEDGSLSHLLGASTKNQASLYSFSAALATGRQTVRTISPLMRQSNPQHQIVDIAQARKRGIVPITQ